jgi:hypothetical protein
MGVVLAGDGDFFWKRSRVVEGVEGSGARDFGAVTSKEEALHVKVPVSISY